MNGDGMNRSNNILEVSCAQRCVWVWHTLGQQHLGSMLSDHEESVTFGGATCSSSIVFKCAVVFQRLIQADAFSCVQLRLISQHLQFRESRVKMMTTLGGNLGYAAI